MEKRFSRCWTVLATCWCDKRSHTLIIWKYLSFFSRSVLQTRYRSLILYAFASWKASVTSRFFIGVRQPPPSLTSFWSNSLLSSGDFSFMKDLLKLSLRTTCWVVQYKHKKENLSKKNYPRKMVRTEIYCTPSFLLCLSSTTKKPSTSYKKKIKVKLGVGMCKHCNNYIFDILDPQLTNIAERISHWPWNRESIHTSTQSGHPNMVYMK